MDYLHNTNDIDPIIEHNAPMDNEQLLAALERLVSSVEARSAK
jgi:hypothetical protein